MVPDAERFIDLATRPLEDNAELMLAARSRLRVVIEESANARHGSMVDAADALERADRSPLLRRWRVVLVAVMLSVSLPLLGYTVRQAVDVTGVMRLFSFAPGDDGHPLSRPDLTPQENLLLFGDQDAADQAGTWKPLWESDPDEPAYLAQYAVAYFQEHKEVSEEILTAADRIDPGNGFFPALSAAGLADGVVDRVKKSSVRGTSITTAPDWKINDEKRLTEALSAIHGFVEKPRFNAYERELLEQRIRLVPAREDFASQGPQLAQTFGAVSFTIMFRKFSDVFAAGARRCAENGDVGGFQQILEDWRKFTVAYVKDSDFVVEALVARLILTSPVATFRDAAVALGLEREANELKALAELAQDDKDARDKATKTSSAQERLIERHSSMMFRLSGPMLARQVRNPPVLTEADLRPGRYADHALFERACSWAAWLLLGLGAGLASLSRFWGNRLAAKLSLRMRDLFRISDYMWVILGGFAFPLMWYFLVTRLTPLAAREWSVSLSAFIQPGGQFGCMFLAMLILTTQLAGWRLARRGAVIGLSPRLSWIGWLAALAALAGVAAFGGMLLPDGVGSIFQKTSMALAGIAVMWIFAGLFLAIFGRPSQALWRATLARVLPAAWIIGMMFFAGLSIYFHSQERFWIQQDMLFAISPEFPAPMRYEYEVTQILRAEVLERLDEFQAAD